MNNQTKNLKTALSAEVITIMKPQNKDVRINEALFNGEKIEDCKINYSILNIEVGNVEAYSSSLLMQIKLKYPEIRMADYILLVKYAQLHITFYLND